MNNRIFHKLSGEMAVHGTLLLIFGLILVTVGQVIAAEQVDRVPIYVIPTWLIPSPPACFCLALKIILIMASLIFAVAIIWLWQKYKLADYLKRWNKPIAYLIISLVCLLVLSILLFMLWLIPPIPRSPVLFYVLGGFALLTSLAFMIAVFCEGLASEFEKVVKGRFQWIYWFIFLLVYVASVSQGLSKLDDKESLVYRLLDYFSFAWSVVIMIFFFKSFLPFLQGFMAGKKTGKPGNKS